MPRRWQARDPKLAAALRALPDNDVLMAGAMADRLVVLGVAGHRHGGRRRPSAGS